MTDKEIELALETIALVLEDLKKTQEKQQATITAIKETLAEHAMSEVQRLGQEIEQEPLAWRNAAIRVGEDLSSVGPDGYYDMTAQQWLDWAMEQQPHGKNSLAQPEQEPVAYPDGDVVGPCICGSWPGGKCLKCPRITTPPQNVIDKSAAIRIATVLGWEPKRKPLTDEEMKKIWYAMQNIMGWYSFQEIARAIEAAHGIKVDA